MAFPFQSYLGLSGDLLERVRLVHGQFGQDLAVEFDVESLQALHKSRIGETLRAAGDGPWILPLDARRSFASGATARASRSAALTVLRLRREVEVVIHIDNSVTVTDNGYFFARRPFLPGRDVGTLPELVMEMSIDNGNAGGFYRRCNIESKRWRLWTVLELTAADREAGVRQWEDWFRENW